MSSILATLELLTQGPIELRALSADRTMQAERFDTVRAAVAWADGQGNAKALYVLMNPFDSAKVTGAGVTDGAVTVRRWLLIDVDPTRPKDSNSADNEIALASSLAYGIEAYLSSEGWPAPVRALSGNGAHLLYRIDLPNDTASRLLVEGILRHLSAEYSTPQVGVDTSVANASRITKLYGTVTRKGPEVFGRPWRLSSITRVPAPLEVVPFDLLTKISSRYQAPAVKPQPPTNYAAGESAYDLSDVLAKVAVRGTREKGGSTFYDIACPWAFEHSGDGGEKETAITVAPDGALGFHCFHSHCSDRKWQDVRDHLAIDTKRWKDRDKREPKPAQSQAIAVRKPEPLALARAEPAASKRVTIASSANRAALLERMDGYARTGSMPGAISSGMGRLDGMLLGGFRPGKFYVLGGETGRGKTTLLMQWAVTAARRLTVSGGVVAVVTPEMDEESIAERVLSAESGIGLAEYRKHPTKSNEQWKQCSVPQNIRASFEATDIMPFVVEEKPSLLIVDYAQQAVSYDNERRHTALAQLGADCLEIAKSRRIPVILGTQVNVTADREFSVRETRILEHQADAVIYIDIVYDKATDGEGRRIVRSQHLLISKNRHGYAGRVPIDWQAELFRFREV